jgi:hypothetical protein
MSISGIDGTLRANSQLGIDLGGLDAGNQFRSSAMTVADTSLARAEEIMIQGPANNRLTTKAASEVFRA